MQTLPEVRERLEELAPLMEKLTELTGKPITTSNDLYYLFHTFMAESCSMGLELPEWANEYFTCDPEDLVKSPLFKGILLEYDIESYNEKLQRLNGGDAQSLNPNYLKTRIN